MIVGLTGGIGSGKTSVANIFRTFGISIIDTDEIAHELTQKHGIALPLIKEVFGQEYITTAGSLDRAKMRSLVFNDFSMKKKLEEILHPLIYSEVERLLPSITSVYGIVVVPLLLEANDFIKMVDRVLVVDCPENLQISRTIQRSQLNEEDVYAIVKAQISRKERLEYADNVIRNDHDFPYLVDQVEKLHQEFINQVRKK